MLKVDAAQPDPAVVQTAAEALRGGAVIILPTDTVYGLAAAADRPEAVAELYRLKQRPADKPLARLAASLEQVTRETGPLNTPTQRLAEAYWPGALTLVLSCNGTPTGYRIPNLALTRAVVAAVGAPILATSANRSGAPDPCSAGEARASFPGKDLLVLDGGPTPGPVPSTVVEISGGAARILREGVIAKQEILDRLSTP